MDDSGPLIDMFSPVSSPKTMPNLFETLDESYSPTPSIGTHIAQSLALSSLNQERDDQLSSSAESLIRLRNHDESSSFPVPETLSPPSLISLEDDVFKDTTQSLPESQSLLSDHNESHDLCRWDYQEDSEKSPLDLGFSNCADNCLTLTSNATPGCAIADDSKMESSETGMISFSSTWLGSQQESTGVGVGLWNLGNTCFINSVLQCFTHTVPLIESLYSYKYQDPCNCGNEEFCVIQVLWYHIDLALRSTSHPISPYKFLHNLNYFSPYFQKWQQEDAHEFLQSFLDKLERCCLNRRNLPGSISLQDNNIVDRVFTGRLVSRLRCCSCNSVSETFEPSVGLSLEIEDVDDLWSALESFTQVEKLEDQLTCDNCKEKVLKEKQLLLDKLPLVITFHLKRFKSNGICMAKIFKHIKFPLELDLRPYMSGSQNNEVSTKYHLYALVEHLGNSLTYGHYSSYVRSAPRIWHLFDDAQVTRVTEESVLSNDTYILFYAREGTPWFCEAYEEMKPCREATLSKSSPKSVFDHTTNGECLSDISSENADKSNKTCDSLGVPYPHVRTDEDNALLGNQPTKYVLLSSESPDKDSTMSDLDEPLRTYDPCSTCTDHPSQQEEPEYDLAEERYATDDPFAPMLMVQNQDSSPKQQGTNLFNRDSMWGYANR